MRTLLIILFLVLWPMANAMAVKVTSLYQVEMAVASQGREERSQAIRDGFFQVLVKLSGDNEIDKNPTIKANLRRADYYVQEYSYSLPSETSSQYLLQIKYDITDVNLLLKKANIAYWGERRPLVLVWLTYTDAEQVTEVIGNEESDNILNSLKEQGKKYGLPLIFPMMDVTDVSRITPDSISSMALPELKEASKRYSPDAILIGNMEVDGKALKSSWQLLLDNHQWDFTIADKTADSIIATALNEVGQTLAKYYVVKATDVSDSWLKLQVDNVTQRTDLIQLIQYLEQLAPVVQVQLSEVSVDTVELLILIRGSLKTFKEKASLGKRLIMKTQELDDNKLIYEWVH